MPTSTPIPSNLDQLNFDQLAQLINERDPELYHQRADEFDRATAGLQQLIDGLRATMRRLEVGLSGLSMDQAAQAAEHLAAKNEAVLHAMQQPGYAAMLRRAAESLASAQQRLRDLQQQRAEQSDAPPEEAGKPTRTAPSRPARSCATWRPPTATRRAGSPRCPAPARAAPRWTRSPRTAAPRAASPVAAGVSPAAVYYGPDGTPQVSDAGYAPGAGGGAVGTMARTFGSPAGIGGNGSGDGSAYGGGTGGVGGGGAGERSGGNAAPWLAASATGSPAVLGQSPGASAAVVVPRPPAAGGGRLRPPAPAACRRARRRSSASGWSRVRPPAGPTRPPGRRRSGRRPPARRTSPRGRRRSAR
ncbi:hypothetical protein [Saccharopolyspora gregorii]|uniref:Uncharacterized protein n=1 Tax=Saccharopolyspora gregorii TaxID=33914 RepID=A0ABP6S307_9PSEU